MTVEDAVVRSLRSLPAEDQRKVLAFAQSLQRQSADRSPLRSSYGLLSGLKVRISEEDIDEIRREMWGDFPRGDIA